MLFEVKKLDECFPGKDSGNQLNTPALPDATIQVADYPQMLQEVVNLVQPGKTVHWMTAGDWSMHHMLGLLLIKTGPADAYISSYAFSEQPARSVASWKQSGLIRKLHCLLDSRIDVRSASALNLVQNAADRCKLCTTHAKVTLLINDQWQVAMVGSANYTTNKRYECGIVSADATVLSFHKTWMENEFAKG